MIGVLLPSELRRPVKVVLLLVAILGLLGVQRCTESPTSPPTCSVSTPPWSTRAGVLPVAYVLPIRLSSKNLRLVDTSRLGGSFHLLRKAAPRSQWLPAQPAYLPKLHRRPRQAQLDSLARAAHHARV